MTQAISFICIGAFFLCGSGTVAAAGNAIHGQQLYQQTCVACHSTDYNGVGPAHKGVFNRKAGSAADYAYSPAVKASTILSWFTPYVVSPIHSDGSSASSRTFLPRPYPCFEHPQRLGC